MTVAAVAAHDHQRAAEFARKQGIPRVVGSYAALVEDPEIDAVYNPLPNGLHGYWTIAALRAGKHVLCEKPFTANADEARAVAEVANGNPGVVVMEAFHYQYHPLTKRLTEIVRSGELGNITNVDVAFSAPLWKKGDIRYQLALAGGATMDMGCYPVSLLRLLAPGPRVISAEANSPPRRRPRHGRPLLAARRRERAHRLLHVLVLGAPAPRRHHRRQRQDLGLQPLRPPSTGTG